MPYPPDLLVRLVLFEIQRGRLSPAQWFEDCQFDETVKWLLFGLRPSRSCLYQFRDRVGPYLDQWNRQILRTARAEGRTPAKRASVDGTFTAAYASRHRLINAKTLATRSQQLDEAVAVDFASQSGRAPGTGPRRRLHHGTGGGGSLPSGRRHPGSGLDAGSPTTSGTDPQRRGSTAGDRSGRSPECAEPGPTGWLGRRPVGFVSGKTITRLRT